MKVEVELRELAKRLIDNGVTLEYNKNGFVFIDVYCVCAYIDDNHIKITQYMKESDTFDDTKTAVQFILDIIDKQNKTTDDIKKLL